jgi:formamidopyrimidine-DNA glycosylase
MPELPEVETVARDLRRMVLGATISGVEVMWPRTVRSGDPQSFADALIGRRIEEVGRRAKLVTLELSGGLVLTIHLKMTGQLFVVPASAPADPYVRVTLAFEDGRTLRFRDIRKFGRMGLARRDAASGDLVGELGARGFKGFGPEPLDPAFTLRRFRQVLRRRKGRLKSLLTDQAFLAGIGNIYADEALWLAQLHPLRTASSMKPRDEARLYNAIRTVLAEAVERRGSSIDDYTAPEGDGDMQERLQVYQRSGEPCPRCGRPVRRIIAGGRSTHFCSWCQRLPAADRIGARQILRSMTPAAVPRRERWTDIGGGAGVVGVTAAEAERAAARARSERTRRAAQTRRAAARGSAVAEPG